MKRQESPRAGRSRWSIRTSRRIAALVLTSRAGLKVQPRLRRHHGRFPISAFKSYGLRQLSENHCLNPRLRFSFPLSFSLRPIFRACRRAKAPSFSSNGAAFGSMRLLDRSAAGPTMRCLQRHKVFARFAKSRRFERAAQRPVKILSPDPKAMLEFGAPGPNCKTSRAHT